MVIDMGFADFLENQVGLDPQSMNMDYNIDIVMCIDATGSMDPILDEVKRTALSFDERFKSAMDSTGKSVNQVRVKVIAFRDYIIDSVPMLESKFFVLPAERNQFKRFVDSIEATGGGDEPENALEALANALKSDWVKTGGKRRHVVMMFTDASALAIGARSKCKGYPTALPRNLADLGGWWEGASSSYRGNFEPSSGRLLLFVPRKSPWKEIGNWSRTWITYSDKNGLGNIDMDNIMNVLTGSVQ